jgi:Tfp pilus assembly protein PilF
MVVFQFRSLRVIARLFLLVLTLSSSTALCQIALDDFDHEEPIDKAEDLSSYTAKELTFSALRLMRDEQPISARTRLVAAIEKDPEYYLAFDLLAEYYLDFVGHFKMALKYLKQGEELFIKQKGRPPYFDDYSAMEHSRHLLALSQIRLNLDNYQGALDALEEFERYNYYNPNYYSSKAWILMKLGRIQEAIESARVGVLSTAGGGALNMLGILLSISNQPEASLRVFDQAIAAEGDERASTPLNNAGEVYRERFKDIKAEQYWIKAKSLRNGCEHVLPSLNLAILLMEHLRIGPAKGSLDTFEDCVKQYTVRNDEEHRSLLALARGRIALSNGDINSSLDFLDQTLARGQWFGKIGTNVNDLKIGALISYVDALEARINQISWTAAESVLNYPVMAGEKLSLKIKKWWYQRKARFLFQSMKNMEDIYIRHSDSVIDYPNLGSLLATFPPESLHERLQEIKAADDRKEANIYYDAYYGEALINHGDISDGMKLVDSSIEMISQLHREQDERALLMHLYLLKAKSTNDETSPQAARAALAAFGLLPAGLRNAGVRLPVTADERIKEEYRLFHQVGFVIMPSGSPHHITLESKGDEFRVSFTSNSPGVKAVELKGTSLTELANKLSAAVFNRKDGI